MNLTRAEQVANAVLYEGHILYPYRPSAVKNRQRWTFGAVMPQTYSLAQAGTEAWTMQTECLVEGGPQTRLDVRVRFLHVQDRTIGALDEPLTDWPEAGEPPFHPVPTLRVGDQVYHTWQESVEREVELADLNLAALGTGQERPFAFPAWRECEAVREEGGAVVGVLVRQQQPIAGVVAVQADPSGPGLFKVRVVIRNETPLVYAETMSRDTAILHGMVSTHTILSVREGAFVSLLDPPDEWRAAAAGCNNIGTWPVLVGEEGEHNLLLSSPIILYDYPQIAAESPGDLFDGTEIDEILTLRIMTLTDDEKQEVRQADVRARALLERTEALPGEDLLKLHGAMRNVRPLDER